MIGRGAFFWLLFCSALTRGQTTLPVGGGTREAEGQVLAAELRAERPPEDSTITGHLKVRDAKGGRKELEIRMTTLLAGSNEWRTIYQAGPERLTVIHRAGATNEYLLEPAIASEGNKKIILAPEQTMVPFAGTDFWVADLGLEFFHWPEQRLVTDAKRNMRLGRACKMLESVNPRAAAGGYRRVISWIDAEYHGLVCADAYDGEDRLLKVFSIKNLDKVQGTWQLKAMEIRNERLNSRTRLDFDLEE